VQAAIKAVEEEIDGRVLVRESGTEPVIRVMTEAKELRDAERYVAQIIDVIKAEGLA
jgi:phosphoglucosamine mutase